MQTTNNNHPLRRWLGGSALSLASTLALAGVGLSTANAGVDFITNGGFEEGVINGVGPDKGAQTAEPWTWWGGGGHQAPYDQGRNPNPSVDANNGSANSWCNFGNPGYVNVASYHTWHFPPTTGMWVVPGATFRVQAQYYIPTMVHNYTSGLDEDNLPALMTEARAGVYLSMRGGFDLQRLLNPNYPGDAASSITTYDQWVSYDFTWSMDPSYTTAGQVNYPSFRIFGGDGTKISDGLNPGGHFDNIQISSDDYRDDLNGYVKDDSGNPIEGAVVKLRSPFFDYDGMSQDDIDNGVGIDEVITLADGSYTLPTWAPHGYEFSVDATLDGYTSAGPKSQTVVESGTGDFPDIIMVAPRAAVEFITNGGFEEGVINGGGPDKGAQTAEPWTYWGGGAHQDPYDQARNPNPSVDANNGSANSWCNFGNPTYKNAASHETWRFPPATGMWVVPGATFRVQAQYYIPTMVHNYTSGEDDDNLPTLMTEARASIYLSMAGADKQYFLDHRYPGDAASSITTYDQWVSYDFTWTVDPSYTTAGKANYAAFVLFGGDGTNIAGENGGALNPGGYFDNLSITSDDYRDDLNGYVKDDSGNPIEGATVTLTSPFTTEVDTVVTLADGSYTLPTWAPIGYEFSVDAALAEYTSDGPESQTVDGNGTGAFPDIIMVAPGNGYANWIADFDVGTETGFSDDSDKDGNGNGLENFFGTDPSVFSAGLAAVTTEGGNTFSFTHPINPTPADDVSAVYRWSEDLQTFYADGDPNGADTTTVSFSPGTPSGGMVTVTATVTGTVIPGKVFVDIEVTQD